MDDLKQFAVVLNRLTRAGLIAISLIILQDWIAGGTPDLWSRISLFALSASLPLLVCDLLLFHMPKKQFSKTTRSIARINTFIGIASAIIGITSAIGHVSWIAGVIFFVSSWYSLHIYFSILGDTDSFLKNKEKEKLAEQTITT